MSLTAVLPFLKYQVTRAFSFLPGSRYRAIEDVLEVSVGRRVTRLRLTSPRSGYSKTTLALATPRSWYLPRSESTSTFTFSNGGVSATTGSVAEIHLSLSGGTLTDLR